MYNSLIGDLNLVTGVFNMIMNSLNERVLLKLIQNFKKCSLLFIQMNTVSELMFLQIFKRRNNWKTFSYKFSRITINYFIDLFEN